MNAIEVEQLRKTYVSHKKAPGVWGGIRSLFSREKNEVEAVKDISFSIGQGEMVGFLGPNGAGKTTTLKMLSGILFPTSGTARVLGYTPSDRKPSMLRKISLVMGNKMQLWWDLPAMDSFLVLKELYEVEDSAFKKRSEFLIETLSLADKVNTQVRKLSLGERMKCELVAALLHSPQIVFLDEPTIGLDVVSQKRIRDFLKELHREDNCTILLTSHYMQDVEELCERVIVIDRGALIYEGTLDSLTRQFSPMRRLQFTFGECPAAEALAKYGKVVESDECSAVVEVERDKVPAVAAAILTRFAVEDVSIGDVDIEEVVRDLFTQRGA
ncbi:MAG: ATP-binding cassette domain-containing protein [Fimbriimonas ginsengisoli]|uniref:ATP-binding cassette domain-containing protein n=1 Tax=Fimbriimonas ginsengisoli TaxID=1005039 RepID=A0A931LVA5_FIMGI|nr:ATP-binding cassette domain-containing protein [Fimbriimonas ginsengisoli]